MFKICSMKVFGFWGKEKASCNFEDDVNIIIGRNGAGKTTFINILKSILDLDSIGLYENEFEYVELMLFDGEKEKLIKVHKDYDDDISCFNVTYHIDDYKYKIRVLSPDEKRVRYGFIRNNLNSKDIESLRVCMDSLVKVSSISVYRLRNSGDLEVRRDNIKVILSPIDYRLEELINSLMQYKLELSMQAQKVSEELQKDVLVSILFSEKDDNFEKVKLEYKGKQEEEKDIIEAYRQLHAYDSVVREKIKFHVKSISKTINSVQESVQEDGSFKTAKNKKFAVSDFMSLESFRKTKNIIKLSLNSKKRTKEIFSRLDLFIETVQDFIEDKSFNFDDNGQLFFYNERYGKISCTKLSSGEKQLIILLIEALLQKEEENIFITDEPELSLHISWQRKIIPAVLKLNPNAQIIAATHSPEIASEYPEKIHKMSGIVHAN